MPFGNGFVPDGPRVGTVSESLSVGNGRVVGSVRVIVLSDWLSTEDEAVIGLFSSVVTVVPEISEDEKPLLG